MPFIPLRFKPGVNRDQTNYTGEGGWWECDKVRFLSGFPQKLGGWVKYTPLAFLGVCRQMFNWITSYTDNFLAVGTNVKVYIEQGGNFYDITPLRVTLSTPDTDNCVDTTDTSTTVNMNVVSHGCSTGDYVTVSGVTGDPGGIPNAEINTEHLITVVDANNFTFEVTSAATSTTTGQGGTAIVIECQISPGNAVATIGSGWGTGGWGGVSNLSSIGTFTVTIASPAVLTFSTHTPVDNTIITLSTTGALPTGLATNTAYYIVNASGSTCSLSDTQAGTPINTTGTQSGTQSASLVESATGWGLGSAGGILLQQRDWWFDNLNNDLIMNIRDGEIYYWQRIAEQDPVNSLNTRAIYLPDLATDEGFDGTKVPIQAMQVLVSQNDKHVITFGSMPYGSVDPLDFDPLLIRWSDQDNPFQWVISATTTAGDLRVSRGSYIVRALPTRQEILVWTNSNLYSLQFTGTTDVFALQELGDNLSIIGPRACISANNVTYWMGQDKFYAYSGRVETLPCTLRNHVFQNINYEQSDQIVCGTNEGWNEIWWFYPSASSNWNDSYVVYNHLERIWYYGTIERTAWLDTALREYPQACTTGQNATSGYLYNHEDGLNDDGSPIVSYIQSNDFDIADGEQFMLTRRLIPDVGFGESTAATPEVTFEMRPRRFPGSGFSGDPADSQPVVETSVGIYTDQVFIRARARQMALKVASQNLNVQWQLGTPRLDARPDGKR